MSFLFRFLAWLPLPVTHALGALLGWVTWLASGSYRRKMTRNLDQAGITDRAVRRRAVAESGRGALEVPAIWFRPLQDVLSWMTEVRGLEHFVRARASGRGLMILTPHLGCYEILSVWVAARGPLTVLYRPPRMASLRGLIEAGRARDHHVALAPTTLGGVRKLMRALRAGEIIGVLPDQVPSFGEGEWVEFFGRPAYTMTLPERLADTTRCEVLVAYVERARHPTRFIAHFHPLAPARPGESFTLRVNRSVELLVRECPAQYLWAYNRFKGTPPQVSSAVS